MRDSRNGRFWLTLFLVTVFLLTNLGFSGGKVYAQDIPSDTPTSETFSTETATPGPTLDPTMTDTPLMEPTLGEFSYPGADSSRDSYRGTDSGRDFLPRSQL